MLAVLWTSAQYAGLREVSVKLALHDDLCELLASGLTARAPVHLWSRPMWRRHLRRWPDTGGQQDAADYLGFFRQACALAHFQSTWNVISRNSQCLPTVT